MRIMLTALLVLAVCPAIAQNKEKASTDISPRTALAFKVSDAAVQKLLPAGFQVNSPTAGPAKGANLNVVLIDYLMMQDMDGKPLPASHHRSPERAVKERRGRSSSNL